MRTLKFYGVSDDLFELEGTTGNEPNERNPGTVEVKDAEGNGLLVHCNYGVTMNACWMVGIAPLDEDIPIPAWPMSFKLGGRGYSTELTIEAPDSAVVSNVNET